MCLKSQLIDQKEEDKKRYMSDINSLAEDFRNSHAEKLILELTSTINSDKKQIENLKLTLKSKKQQLESLKKNKAKREDISKKLLKEKKHKLAKLQKKLEMIKCVPVRRSLNRKSHRLLPTSTGKFILSKQLYRNQKATSGCFIKIS